VEAVLGVLARFDHYQKASRTVRDE